MSLIAFLCGDGAGRGWGRKKRGSTRTDRTRRYYPQPKEKAENIKDAVAFCKYAPVPGISLRRRSG